MPLEMATEPVILRVPRARFHYGDVTCAPLFESLAPDTIVHVVAGAMMLERRLIFLSASLPHLSHCIHAAMSLLYPFRFEVCTIPLVPPSLVEMAMATFPFVLGFHASLAETIRALPLEQVVFVDLDRGTATVEERDVQLLPRGQATALVSALKRANSDGPGTSQWNLAVQDAFVDFFCDCFGHFRKHILEGGALDKVCFSPQDTCALTAIPGGNAARIAQEPACLRG